MTLSKGTKSTIWLGSITLVLFIFMLAFRAFIYADMYIAPDEPYGISDIIEYLLGCVFLALTVMSVTLSVILLFKGSTQSKRAGVCLVLFCGLLFMSYSPLHDIAARLGG
ncbi:MAG: hypothetical protein KUG81_03375 [Gammaproteobacteria bacterium]|nr:hypothetical protein [Gammaproteobacteria bacterium]